MVIAGFLGGAMAGDPKEFRRLNWMPFVTQAGVSLGLAVIIEESFPDWGKELATVIIGVIVLNQVFGPPFFKWAIQRLGEDHGRKPTPEFDGVRDAILFGIDYQSKALARQLQRHGWLVRIVTCVRENFEERDDDLEVIYLEELTAETLKGIDNFQAEAIVCFMDDDQNYLMCELAFEHLGTKDLIVVLRDSANWKRFKDLGVVVVEPATAMVGLLDHMVRSPQATQLLLGMDENQDSLDVEVLDPALHGILLRDLKLPKDVIILSVRRNEQVIIPHGYTRLRLHDYLSVVGSNESLDEVALKLGPVVAT
jgi:Trk K+ transport system NAD-binding subunit